MILTCRNKRLRVAVLVAAGGTTSTHTQRQRLVDGGFRLG
jgi:hypothetical protein